MLTDRMLTKRKMYTIRKNAGKKDLVMLRLDRKIQNNREI